MSDLCTPAYIYSFFSTSIIVMFIFRQSLSLCAPAILYLGFSIIQIIIDIFRNSFNTAILKFFIMLFFTLILNILCKKGLTIVSWIIVFLPFIFMTVITSTLLILFGIDPQNNFS